MKVGLTKGNFGSGTTQSVSYDSALGDAEAFVLFVTNHTTTGTLTDGNGLCIWMSDGTNEYSAYSWISAGGANTGHNRGRNTGGYLEEDGTVRLDGTSSIDTANDEIDFTFDASEVPNGYEYCLVTFHGTDVNALCVSHDGTDQTESIGFDWDFLVSTGASTTSTTSTNAAMNWGVCDKSGNQGVIRYGADDGTGIHFSVFRDDAIATNIFSNTQFEVLDVDTITTNGFNLDCSVASNNDEPGVYLCIGCDNSVEVVTNEELTAATGDETVTVSHQTEYGLFGGAINNTTVDTIEYSLGGGNTSLFVGACDLSAGADTSGDYFAYGWGGDSSNVEAELTHSGCIVGTDGTAGNSVLADISSVAASTTTVGKATADATTRMWFLNIGEEPAGGAKALAGVVSAGATTVGNLTGPKALAGVVQAAANTIAELGRETYLNGVAQAAASTIGSLGRETYLAGVVQGVATVLADTLAASGQIEGVIEAAATVFGDLTRQAPLEALSTGQATTVGSLTAERPLAGTATGMASTVGSLTKGRLLEGVSTGQASTVGSLGRTAPLEGVSTGQASVAGVITRQINLSPAPVQAGATVIGALTQTTPEDTARTDDSYEVMSKLQGPQRWGPQNPPRVYTFFEEYKLKGTEGAGTVIRLVVLPPHAQVVNLALSHDNLGTHLLQIGNQDDEDCYAADQDVSSGGVIVPSTYAVAARPMREAQIIQVKFTGSGAINPGGIIRIHGVSVQPTHRIRGEQEHT